MGLKDTVARGLASYTRLTGSAGTGKKERVVILGSGKSHTSQKRSVIPFADDVRIGWAGYAFARTLDPAKYERILVSPRSHFVFTPLLASTAVGTLEFRAILESVRRLGKNVAFYQGWADDVDFARKVVRVEENTADDLSGQTSLLPPDDGVTDGQVEPSKVFKGAVDEVPYDKLVVAVGSYSQTFGIEGVRQHASLCVPVPCLNLEETSVDPLISVSSTTCDLNAGRSLTRRSKSSRCRRC